MREPTEAGDDVAVACPALDASLHVAVPGGICVAPQRSQEPESTVLFRDVFAVMKRVIEPDTGDRMQRPVETPVDGVVDDLEREGVARIGFDGCRDRGSA